MTRHPLTLAQATALCENHNHLIGRRFDRTGSATIECLAIAPFDDINQHILMSQLREMEDYNGALQNYGGCLFEVIVIARSPEVGAQFLYKRLRDYLTEMNGIEKGVVYNGD